MWETGISSIKEEEKPLLVACDIYRPAAIKQLQVVSKAVGCDFFEMGDKVSAVDIAKNGIEYARKNGNDYVIIDTAGRLHIDESLMDELVNIKKLIQMIFF